MGAPFKPPANKKPDVAYRNTPPVYRPEIAQEVYDRAIKASLVISHEELLSLSPEVRAKWREAVTIRRAPPKETTTNANLYEVEPDDLSDVFETFFNPTYAAVVGSQHRAPPPGATIIPDPYESYYRGLNPGEKPDADYLTVAKETCALRSIFPLIDNNQKVECILDPGCQIVAMASTVGHRLGITYDPDIILNMLSANGTVDSSLGLARNVPFNIGNLTFYMQVHIIQSPAYDILLGRPFDVLTESVVRNYKNTDQTITVHDPNTNRKATIPTSARRGMRRRDDEEYQGFHE